MIGVIDMAMWPWLHWCHEVNRCREFKDRCLKILDDVTQPTAVVVTKRGRPVARVVPFADAKKGTLIGSVLKEVGDPFGTGDSWDADRS